MLDRTLVLELHVARLQGLLPGDTPAERFQSFLRHLRQPEVVRALFHEYPVLARQLIIALENFVDSSLSFLERLCADWEAIRAAFSPGRIRACSSRWPAASATSTGAGSRC